MPASRHEPMASFHEASQAAPQRFRGGLRFSRRFTAPGVHPFDEIEWDTRSASITNDKGENIFQQDNVEVPKGWSQIATNVVASKYFRGYRDTAERESSVRHVITHRAA